MKKIIITGNVGKDGIFQADSAGKEFASFSVGVSVGTKQNPKTDWVDITCNGKLADVARNYVKKGTKVLVEGFPSVYAYINRENKAIGILRIYANNIELLTRKDDPENFASSSNESNYTLPDVPSTVPVQALSNDDIPF